MSDIPADLKYTKSHEWVRLEDDGSATVGISFYAQELLGELVFVELPEVGSQLSVADEAGVVESVKTASDIYSPVTGEIIEINENLNDEPGLVNTDPYDAGWIFRIHITDQESLEDLLSPEDYQQLVESTEE